MSSLIKKLDYEISVGSYSDLRAYRGSAKRVYITGSLVTVKPAGIAGTFQLDQADATSADNGGTIIVGSDGRRWKRDYSGAVSVGWFGAGSSNDDTAAFVAANTYLMGKTLPASNQLVGGVGAVLHIPAGEYYLSGSRIFGSIIPTGSPATQPPRFYQVHSEGASLVWNAGANDELFYFDGSIDHPIVKGVNIFVTGGSSSTAVGTVFSFYSNLSVSNQYNASKFHLEDVSVFPGRATANGDTSRIKRVFRNQGNAMCDQAWIENCRFWYYDALYVGENPEAVNWTFSSCGFFANSSASAPATHFSFSKIQDNFNVLNCSFSLGNRETLVKTNSISSIEVTDSNINFDNCRFEADIGGGGSGFVGTATVSAGKIVSIAVTNGGSGYTIAPVIEIIDSTGIGATATCAISGGVIQSVTVVNQGAGYSSAPSIFAKQYHVTIADMNFGSLNMRNSTWFPASNGAYFQEVRLRANARFSADNVRFIDPQFYLPVFDGSLVGSGTLYENAVSLNNCVYQNRYDVFTSLTSDPGYAYRYTAKVIGGYIVRGMKARGFGQYNGQEFFDFDIASTPANTMVVTGQSRQVSVAYNNSGTGRYIQLPPYQTITSIKVNNAGNTSVKYYRVYFGDKSAGNYTDTEVINYNTFVSTSYDLFDGLATVFDDKLENQKLYIAALDSSKNEITTTSPADVLITYKPLQWKTLGVLSAPATKIDRHISQTDKVYNRPVEPPYVGYSAFDLNIGKPIWWNGYVWKDSSGASV